MVHFETFYKRRKKKKTAVAVRSAVTVFKKAAEHRSTAFRLDLITEDDHTAV